MKRKVMALLTAALLLAGTVLPVNGVWAEEELELTVSGGELAQTKGDDLSSLLDQILNNNATIMGSLGQTDWTALAESVEKTGKWRDDLVAVAQTQVGYRAEANGDTIYTQWAEKPAGEAWDAMFVSWAAEKAGLTDQQFPKGNSYEELKAAMKKVGAVKEISRANYPNTGDVALLTVDGTEIAGVVAYVSNGYAAVIHARGGEVVRETYLVSGKEFQQYVDMNVLMERAGLESGKGGEAPAIPEGGVAAWTNTNAVYMRKEPTTASKSVTTVKKSGTALLVVSAEKQEDGYIWYGVEYKSYKGYIRGDLLKLDMAAVTIPVEEDEATEAPEQEETGCVYCKAEAGKVVLPVDCCYEHLAKLGTEYAGLFMNALREVDKATWELYVKCHDAHVRAGAEQIVPLGGLSLQDRVVNVEVAQSAEGQLVNITFDIYGAAAYEWHEVRVDAEGTTDTVIADAVSETLSIEAKADASYSYYCVATILSNGNAVRVTGKMTMLDVNVTQPIMAEAILGEEVNFTYTYEGAASYQWYVLNPDTNEIMSIEGATESTYTTYAEADNSGLYYYCVAADANGQTLGQSGYYAYTIKASEEILDEDLVKYVDELAHMTLNERYTALNTTWKIAVSETDSTTISEKVIAYWENNLQAVYPNLLCTCDDQGKPSSSHDESCSWYVNEYTVEDDSGLSDYYDCSKFPEECGVVTSWLTRKAGPMEIYTYLSALDSDTYLNLLWHANAAHPQIGELLCTCDLIYESPVVPGEAHAEDCPWHVSGVDSAEFAAWMTQPHVTGEIAQLAYEAVEKGIALDEALGVTSDGCLLALYDGAVLAELDENNQLIDTRYHIPVAELDAEGNIIPLTTD